MPKRSRYGVQDYDPTFYRIPKLIEVETARLRELIDQPLTAIWLQGYVKDDRIRIMGRVAVLQFGHTQLELSALGDQFSVDFNTIDLTLPLDFSYLPELDIQWHLNPSDEIKQLIGSKVVGMTITALSKYRSIIYGIQFELDRGYLHLCNDTDELSILFDHVHITDKGHCGEIPLPSLPIHSLSAYFPYFYDTPKQLLDPSHTHLFRRLIGQPFNGAWLQWVSTDNSKDWNSSSPIILQFGDTNFELFASGSQFSLTQNTINPSLPVDQTHTPDRSIVEWRHNPYAEFRDLLNARIIDVDLITPPDSESLHGIRFQFRHDRWIHVYNDADKLGISFTTIRSESEEPSYQVVEIPKRGFFDIPGFEPTYYDTSKHILNDEGDHLRSLIGMKLTAAFLWNQIEPLILQFEEEQLCLSSLYTDHLSIDFDIIPQPYAKRWFSSYLNQDFTKLVTHIIDSKLLNIKLTEIGTEKSSQFFGIQFTFEGGVLHIYNDTDDLGLEFNQASREHHVSNPKATWIDIFFIPI